MSIAPENLVRHELVGLRVRIAESSDPAHEKVSGTVVDETYGTLRIETARKISKKTSKERTEKIERIEKIIPKSTTIFIFALPNKTEVQVDGRLLVGRPEDRIKKKLPRW
jgi:ribonuclease P protein subunit POP4